MALVRLANRELRHGPRDGLALDARKLRADQRAMQTDFFGRRRCVAVIAVKRPAPGAALRHSAGSPGVSDSDASDSGWLTRTPAR